MSKAKLKERQRKNQIKNLIELGDQGKLKDNKLVGATALLNEAQQAFYDQIMPLVKAGIKTSTIYYLVPQMQVLDIYEKDRRWILKSKQLRATKQFKEGQITNQSLKSLIDVDGVAIFVNQEGKVFMPDVEQVVVEKVVTKTESTGIKMRDIDKNIQHILHKFKDNDREHTFLTQIFESFKEGLK
jgi:hypothetical protein